MDSMEIDSDAKVPPLPPDDNKGTVNEQGVATAMAEEPTAFATLLGALRRNDADIASVDTSTLPHAVPPLFGKELGESLKGNTQVSSLVLDLPLLVPFPETLLDYLRDSKFLRHITLHSFQDDQPSLMSMEIIQLAARCLEVIVGNSHISSLRFTLHHEHFPHEAFQHFMVQTPALKTLILPARYFMVAPGVGATAAAPKAPDSIKGNQSLETLEVYTQADGASLDYILQQLDGHVSLTTLKLTGWTFAASPNVIKNYLLSTTTLRHLALEGYRFEGVAMDGLVLGLLANRSLHKLSVLACLFDDQAHRLFFGSFLQGSNHSSSIREFHYDTSADDRRSSCGDIVRPSFNGGADTAATIGMSLDTLHLAHTRHLSVPNFDSFFTTMSQYGDAIRLRRLCLDLGHHTIMAMSWGPLCTTLPNMVLLHELELRAALGVTNQHDNAQRQEQFVAALNRNTSLHCITFEPPNSFLNETNAKRVQRYLIRNQQVSVMSALTLLVDPTTAHTTLATPPPSRVVAVAGEAEDRPAHRLGTTQLLLIGLVAVGGDAIGYLD